VNSISKANIQNSIFDRTDLTDADVYTNDAHTDDKFRIKIWDKDMGIQ